MGSRERLGEATRLRPRHRVGDGHCQSLVNHRHRRLSPTADHRHNPVAEPEPAGVRPVGHDFARQLESEDVRRRTGRGRVDALGLEEIGVVYPGGVNSNEDLARSGDRVGPFLDHGHAAIRPGRDDGLHLRQATAAVFRPPWNHRAAPTTLARPLLALLHRQRSVIAIKGRPNRRTPALTGPTRSFVSSTTPSAASYRYKRPAEPPDLGARDGFGGFPGPAVGARRVRTAPAPPAGWWTTGGAFPQIVFTTTQPASGPGR